MMVICTVMTVGSASYDCTVLVVVVGRVMSSYRYYTGLLIKAEYCKYSHIEIDRKTQYYKLV